MNNKPSFVLSPEAKTELVKRLVEFVTEQCTVVDAEARFDSTFDELNEDSLPDWLSHCTPSQVLKEMDPTAYRCGVADMTGTDDSLREINGEYYDGDEVEKAQSEFVDQLESELEEVKIGIDVEENLEPGETVNEETLTELRAKADLLAAQIEVVRKYTF